MGVGQHSRGQHPLRSTECAGARRGKLKADGHHVSSSISVTADYTGLAKPPMSFVVLVGKGAIQNEDLKEFYQDLKK